MFRRIIVCSGLLTQFLWSNAIAQTYVSGYVSGEWISDYSPYIVTDTIKVHGDSALYIDPGVEIVFSENFTLEVFGTLYAVGTSSDSITFTALDSITGFGGVIFNEAGDNNALSYCIFEHALTSKATVYCDFTELTLTNSTIRNNTAQGNQNTKSGGYFGWDSQIDISNCVFVNNSISATGCEGGGIRLEECIGLISECLITENYSSCDAGGIYLLNSNVTISGCEIANNFGNSETGGVYIEEGYPIIIGCTITGNRGKWNTGGGIYIKDAYPVIGGSAENSNIIKDNVTDSWGNDIYAYYSYPNSTLINASYNHLRVYPATPAIIGDCEHFDLSNCTGDYSPISEDIYVSPLGSSTNSGLSPDEPLNTITLATIRSMPSENNPITIYLDPGVYTDANGGEEIFPINIMPYSTLQGSGVDETLIKINTNYNAIRTDWSNAAISDIHITAEDSCRIGLYMVGDNQIIQNCLIDNFYGDFWVYGIRVGNGLNQLISNTVVRNCSTPLYYYGNTGEISNCTFEYNDRAAYFSNGSQGTISSCIFRHNHTYYYGGGVRLSTNSTDDRPWFKNCLFHDNIALLGGAVFCENDDDNLGPIFENCVIYNNQAEQSGGAFYADHDTQVNIINSIVFGNTQLEGYQLAWYDETFNYNIEYSDISDTLWPGTGNLNANPGFSDPANYEFQLQTNSVCIDAGSPNPYYNDIEDPANQGFAQYPSRGTIRNDIGVFGGPLAGEPFLRTSPVFKENILEEYLTLRTFPNPFNSHMEIEFALPSAGRVRLSVYNLLGREIAILADEFYPSGLNRYNWNAQQFSSGFYFARIETQNKSITQKVLLLK